MLQIRAFNQLKTINDKVNEDEFQGYFPTHYNYYSCSWIFVHIIHQHASQNNKWVRIRSNMLVAQKATKGSLNNNNNHKQVMYTVNHYEISKTIKFHIFRYPSSLLIHNYRIAIHVNLLTLQTTPHLNLHN